MTSLLEIKEKIKSIYSKYDIFLNPWFKFILALCVFSIINGNIGYMERANTLTVTLAVSLVCAILPANVMVLLAAAAVLLHLYALSLEVMAVAFVLFLLMGLMYFRFSPKNGIYTLLMPVCLHFNLGPVMPIAVGLMGNVPSAISFICGVVAWYFLDGVKQNALALSGRGGSDGAVTKITAALNQLIGNKEMYLVILTFLVVFAVVLLIRSLSIDYAWTAAIIIGGLVNFIVLFAGYVMLGISEKVVGLVIGSLMSLAVAFVLEFFFFHLDYTRTERVQFEDDEYYYYVKAVPKMYVAEKEKQVKTFPARGGGRSKRSQASRGRRARDD